MRFSLESRENQRGSFIFLHTDNIQDCCSVAQSCLTLWDPMDCSRQASLSFTISRSLLKLMSIQSVMPSNHLVLCRSLLLLPSILPSTRVFSNELDLCIRWLKYWSCSFSISLSNEYSGLISLRIDWVWSPCSSRDSQESSLASQFESINSSALFCVGQSNALLKITPFLAQILLLRGWLNDPVLDHELLKQPTV